MIHWNYIQVVKTLNSELKKRIKNVEQISMLSARQQLNVNKCTFELQIELSQDRNVNWALLVQSSFYLTD